MSLPTQEQNGVFTHVYPVTDLGLASNKVVTSAAAQNLTVFNTGGPATVVCVVALVSGSGTLKMDACNGTPDYGSPDVTLSLTGTSNLVAVMDTDLTYDDSDPRTTTISADTRFVGIQLSSGSAMEIAKMAVFVLYELTAGEDWYVGLRSSANAVFNRTIGDGSGKVSLDPAATASSILL